MNSINSKQNQIQKRTFPKKQVLIAGILIFYVVLFFIGYSLGKSLTSNVTKERQQQVATPVILETYPTNTTTQSFPYKELITTPDTISKLTNTDTGLSFLADNSAKLSLTATKIVFENGQYYIELDKPLTVQFKTQKLELPKDIKILVNADAKAIILLSGKIRINKNREASRNQKLLFRGDKIDIIDFDRKELKKNKPWPSFLNAMKQNQLLPGVLTDLNAPKLVDILPKSKTVEKDSITVYGTTDVGAKIYINSKSVKVNNKGKFQKSISLKVGTNKIKFVASDDYGNKTTKYTTITRKLPATSTSSGSSSNPNSNNCSGSFSSQLLCLINNHRNANGLGSLSFNSNLNTAAQNHSSWMNANNTLNHTGSGGSSPWDRCANAGQACDAENIAYSPDSSAQTVFNLWKNSSGHNANMLGSHGIIGLGISGGYATAVFY